jgi:hypothetical protein
MEGQHVSVRAHLVLGEILTLTRGRVKLIMMWKAKKYEVVSFVVATVAVDVGDLSLLDGVVPVQPKANATTSTTDSKYFSLYITRYCSSLSHCGNLVSVTPNFPIIGARRNINDDPNLLFAVDACPCYASTSSRQ